MKLAVIGTGDMGRKHAGLVAAHDACSLVGVCDEDASRASTAAEFSTPFYRDVSELLNGEHPIGTIIATPNSNHADAVEVCARHGVHVLVEKPIADSQAAAERIIQAGDEAGIQVLVGHHRRYNPLVQRAKSIIDSGELGQLVGVSMLWALMKPADYLDVAWRCQRPGGGPNFINLIHEFDLARFLCGEIRQVFAHTSSAVRQLEVEDSLSISLSFGNGAVRTVLASDTVPSPWSYEATTHENPLYFHTDEDCYHFLGTRGSLAFPSMDVWQYADARRIGWQHPQSRTSHEVVRADPLVSQLEHFCRVVRGEEEPAVTARDAARSLATVLAVQESADNGVRIDMAAT